MLDLAVAVAVAVAVKLIKEKIEEPLVVEEEVEQVAHQVMEVQEELLVHLDLMVVQELKPLVVVEVAVVIMKTKLSVDLVDLADRHKEVQLSLIHI